MNKIVIQTDPDAGKEISGHDPLPDESLSVRHESGGIVAEDLSSVNMSVPKLYLIHELDHRVRKLGLKAGQYCWTVGSEDFAFSKPLTVVFRSLDIGYIEVSGELGELPRICKTRAEVVKLGGGFQFGEKPQFSELGEFTGYFSPDSSEKGVLKKSDAPFLEVGDTQWYPFQFRVKKSAFKAVASVVVTHFRMVQQHVGKSVSTSTWQLSSTLQTNFFNRQEYLVPFLKLVRDTTEAELKQLAA